jgi:stage IV sporulation protein FB
MFAIPAPTDYDVKFPLLGIPVRIHPLFWAMAAALGWESHPRFYVLVWIGCVFVSILVHEFGHALTTERLNRVHPSVFLYLMGGLCAYDGDERRPWRRAAVLIMGPGAGFLLFGLTLALGLSVLGFADFWPVGLRQVHDRPDWFFKLPEWAIQAIYIAYDDLLWINLFWGLFNLLPIYPLDGGQLASVFLTMHDRREGPARAYILGILTAGGIAIYFATLAMKSESTGAWINVLFLANLAFMNYQLLQAAQAHKNSRYSFEDDDDWWRK